jgi:hypothetical protein
LKVQINCWPNRCPVIPGQLELSMPEHHRLLTLESKQATSDNHVVNQPYDPQEKRTEKRYLKK